MRSFDVTTTAVGPEVVDADNWTITTAGALIFQVGGRATAAYAPGVWLHVEVSAASE